MALVIQVLPLPVAAALVHGVIGGRVGELPTDPSWQVLLDEDGGVAPASIIHVRGPSSEACFLRRLRSNMMFLFVGTYWVRIGSEWPHGDHHRACLSGSVVLEAQVAAHTGCLSVFVAHRY